MDTLNKFPKLPNSFKLNPMIKNLQTKLLSLALLFSVSLSAYETAKAQCTPRALPFTENFSGTPFAACTPTIGGWTSTEVPSGAGWWLPNTNYAGGSVPEVEGYGNQANGGVSETIRLKSPPLNTTGAASINLSFKHNLYLTNSAASGSGVITITVEYSADTINWNWAYSAYYNATPSLQSVVAETRNIKITGLSANTTYIRYSISGVLFKVWGWEIDNINVTVGSFTSIASNSLNERIIYHNPSDKTLMIDMADGVHANIMLHDALGNIVYRSAISGRTVIDVGSFAKGVYILRMENEAGSVIKKLMLQ
jgi:hypothetical protein